MLIRQCVGDETHISYRLVTDYCMQRSSTLTVGTVCPSLMRRRVWVECLVGLALQTAAPLLYR